MGFAAYPGPRYLMTVPPGGGGDCRAFCGDCARGWGPGFVISCHTEHALWQHLLERILGTVRSVGTSVVVYCLCNNASRALDQDGGLIPCGRVPVASE